MLHLTKDRAKFFFINEQISLRFHHSVTLVHSNFSELKTYFYCAHMILPYLKTKFEKI